MKGIYTSKYNLVNIINFYSTILYKYYHLFDFIIISSAKL